MKTIDKILSKRFRDDGFPEIGLPGAAAQAVKQIRREIADGGLKQLSHQYCPLCGWENAFLIAAKDRVGLPVKNVVCENCGLFFSDSYLDRDSAVSYFKRYCNLFTNKGRSAEEMFTARTAPASYSRLRYEWLKENLGPEFSAVRTVMEIGANDGCNLFPFHQQGCVVYGCDFDEERMDAGRARGMKLLSGGVETLQKLSTKADLLIFSHSLEYMPDVEPALKIAINLLTEDGKIYIEVPGLKRWIRRSEQRLADGWLTSTNDLHGCLIFDHAFFFERETLLPLAARAGLKLVKGDDFIRMIFKVGEAPAEAAEPRMNYGPEIVDYLEAVENDWRKKNPSWKQVARKLKRALLAIGK